ncbi:serine O-acetyltransferase [Pseudomonas guariconensis]|uniref:serine O-acetyltransferase n=1 Tax=Pseudomonas guariconensis TaxID=1288410 RepID=UPI00366B31B5
MIRLYRLGHWLYRRNFTLAGRLIRNVIYLIANSYIPSSAKIGKGTVLAYGGIGVVIHANAVIGEDCVIGQNVTIGAIEGYASPLANRCPQIGNNCYIAAGAKILGGIVIGDNCQIGAGAVVLKDAPAHSVLVGMPARVIKHTPSDFRAIVR